VVQLLLGAVNALVAVVAGLALLLAALARAVRPLAKRAAGGVAVRGRRGLSRLLRGARAAIPVVWTGLLVVGCLASAALLVASDLAGLRTIRTGETTLEQTASGPHHAYLHALAAAAIVALLARSLARNKPALLVGVAASGLAALIVCLAADLPAVLSAGSWPGRYEGVSTRPGAGFWLGLAGSILAVVSALALLRNRSRGRRVIAQRDRPAIWATWSARQNPSR
jgi:hypothetical protein